MAIRIIIIITDLNVLIPELVDKNRYRVERVISRVSGHG